MSITVLFKYYSCRLDLGIRYTDCQQPPTILLLFHSLTVTLSNWTGNPILPIIPKNQWNKRKVFLKIFRYFWQSLLSIIFGPTDGLVTNTRWYHGIIWQFNMLLYLITLISSLTLIVDSKLYYILPSDWCWRGEKVNVMMGWLEG